MQDLSLVISFLNSPEGEKWIQDNYELLESVHDYVTSGGDLINKNHIEKLAKFFPEFLIHQKAYRFISQAKEKETPLLWSESYANISWSKRQDAYRSVLKSYSITGQKIQIYQALVSGLDLHLFITTLRPYFDKYQYCVGLTKGEDEILVFSYSELDLVETVES